MKEICAPKNHNEASEMGILILSYLKGNIEPTINNGVIQITEKLRQFFTWGACNYMLIGSKCGCYGLQFNVSGLLFKGRIRIYYNPSSDYFDVELLRPRKEEVVKSFIDVDFMQLHNICHQNIERKDDIEV